MGLQRGKSMNINVVKIDENIKGKIFSKDIINRPRNIKTGV